MAYLGPFMEMEGWDRRAGLAVGMSTIRCSCGHGIQGWDDDNHSLHAALIWIKRWGIRWLALPGQAMPLTSAATAHVTLCSHVMEEVWDRTTEAEVLGPWASVWAPGRADAG